MLAYTTNSKVINSTVTYTHFQGIKLFFSSGNKVAENKVINVALDGIRLEYSNQNFVTENFVENARLGISLTNTENSSVSRNKASLCSAVGIHLARSYDNRIYENLLMHNSVGLLSAHCLNTTNYHNNFIDNIEQVNINNSTSAWDNSIEGNYWSNYTGVDLQPDGIGDTPYTIDGNNTDNHPLMGMFHSFNTSLDKYVNVVSNSTIEDFQYFQSNKTIKMFVSNMTSNQTCGFCRVTVPHALMNVTNIEVIIDNGTTPLLYYNYTLYDNGTHRWIYFSYPHSTREIDIITEFPSFLILPLFMTATLLAVIVYKRKHQTRNKKREV